MSNSAICLDASVVIRLVADPSAAAIAGLFEQWAAQNRLLVAPALLYFEVANALYQYHRHNILSKEAVLLALQAAQALPIQVQQPSHLHQRAVELAQTHGLPATYDAHYLALAELLAAELWTADLRLFKLVTASLPWVHVITSAPK